MKAAGLALACLVIGGGMAAGYIAADPDVLADVSALDFLQLTQKNEPPVYPQAVRDTKLDRMVALRTDREDIESSVNRLQRGDSLRQSYAATDPAAPPPPAADTAEKAPLPKPRPRVQLLRRQQASYTLLSDLQIDAIRTRLKLTAEQERSWPAVEAALRGLATRLHTMKTSGETPTELPSESPELVKLKEVATPFFAQLNGEQKRELKMLAHLIGLGKVVAAL